MSAFTHLPWPNPRPLSDEDYNQLSQEDLERGGLAERREGAPADFGGVVLSNPDHVQAHWDTDLPPVTRLPHGVAFNKQNFSGSPTFDISNPAPADVLQPAIRNTSMIGPVDDNENEEQPRPRIAAPGLGGGANPRGLPAPGSTEDLEAHAAASRMQSTPVAKPSALETRTTADQAELARLQNTGSGISQIKNPIARGALRGLETVGGILSPRSVAMIPGTELHHNALLGQASDRIGQDVKQAQEEATTAKTGADTEEAQARTGLFKAQTDAARNPKTGLTPEETTIHDLMTGENGQPRLNPKTGKSYSYLEAYQAVNQAKQDVKPEKPEKPDTPEQQFIDEYQRTHQGATVAQAVSAYAAATQKPEKPGAGSARSDKSYTYNNDKLDKLGKPVEDSIARMGRLQESLAQNTPQADALVAPELLTVMAGGAGSGLRMNEAEISRVVGGRSKWESLKASINQWQLDPSKANSITPEQRQQIRALVEAVNTKLQKKLQALDQAREGLLNSDDPKEHRRIVTNAHHALTQVDEEAPGSENAGGGGGKTLSMSAIERAAKDHGISVDEAKKQAQAQGYTVK